MSTRAAIELTARCIEAAGVIAIVGGGMIAIALAVSRFRTTHDGTEVYRAFRHDLGRAIIIGLELLVAADIVQTIGDRPSLLDLAVLAGIVGIRTVLSFTLEVELEGRWPWQRTRDDSAPLRSSNARTSLQT